MSKRTENGSFTLPPSATEIKSGYANGDASMHPQHAGLVLSPSKKCKLSPDSVVMITPAANPLTDDNLDGLSAAKVRERHATHFFFSAVPAAHAP